MTMIWLTKKKTMTSATLTNKPHLPVFGDRQHGRLWPLHHRVGLQGQGDVGVFVNVALVIVLFFVS